MRIFLTVLVLSVSCTLQSSAAPDEAAFVKFVQGSYGEAVDIAVAIGGAENLALAARSLNAKAYLQADDKTARALTKEALNFAEQSIEADEALVEAHLQAAISLAQRGSLMAPLRAFFLGIASRARDELDVALSQEPDNAWALSSSAAWHLEVARRVGEGRYGSDSELGYQQFVAARATDPENLLIAYECALRLLAFGEADWRETGLSALAEVIAGTPRNAFEQAMQERAVRFRAAIDVGRDVEQAFIQAQP